MTKNKIINGALKILTWFFAAITVISLVFLVGYILVRGVPALKPSLFEWNYTSENVSLMPAMISTVLMVGITLVLAVPVGVCTAIYLTEYANKNSRIVKLIRLTTETLAGIPSIIYGLFGMLFFVVFFGFGYSIISGAFTLAIMTLPLITRSTEEALLSVPISYKEAAIGLGAGRLATLFKITLPAASPGILSGIILAIGRMVGETAALIYTSGTVAQIPKTPLQSARTLSVHMYALSSEGLHTEEAYGTAVVLMLLVILINWFSSRISKRITKGQEA